MLDSLILEPLDQLRFSLNRLIKIGSMIIKFKHLLLNVLKIRCEAALVTSICNSYVGLSKTNKKTGCQ